MADRGAWATFICGARRFSAVCGRNRRGRNRRRGRCPSKDATEGERRLEKKGSRLFPFFFQGESSTKESALPPKALGGVGDILGAFRGMESGRWALGCGSVLAGVAKVVRRHGNQCDFSILLNLFVPLGVLTVRVASCADLSVSGLGASSSSPSLYPISLALSVCCPLLPLLSSRLSGPACIAACPLVVLDAVVSS